MSDGPDRGYEETREAFVARDWEAVLTATEGEVGGAGSLDRLGWRGWALYHLGHYQDGLQIFDKILSLAPQTADAALGRGRCYRMLGRVDDAADAFWLAHQLSPGDAHPLCERGAVLILDERWDDALADYRAAEALDPSHPGLASYFAELYLYSGHPDEAIAAARAGLEREPGSVMHRVNLAHGLLFSGRLDEALEEYAAIADQPVPSEGVTGESIVLNDFRLMREAGLESDYAAVEAMLGSRARR